jgi:hypothetical protein
VSRRDVRGPARYRKSASARDAYSVPSSVRRRPRRDTPPASVPVPLALDRIRVAYFMQRQIAALRATAEGLTLS